MNDIGDGVRRRSMVRALSWLLVGVLLGVGASWSMTKILADDSVAIPTATPTIVRAADGELSRSQTLSGVLTVQDTGEYRLSGSGTITGREQTAANSVESGSVVVTLDLDPVVAIEGQVPMFRDLTQGDTGADVLQLQQFLRAENYLDSEPDGDFGRATTLAVQAWQRDQGQLRPSGRVRGGSVVALGTLPADFRYPESVTIGAAISAGDVLVIRRGDDGVVFVAIPETRIGDFDIGTRATVSSSDDQVPATVTRFETADGEIGVVLEPAQGTFCEVLPCEALSPSTPLAVTVDFEIVPPSTGVIVPVSALRIQPDETLAVQADNGEMIPVEVLVSDRGQAIVDGISAGQRVVIG